MPVLYPCFEAVHEPIMWNTAKTVFYITFEYMILPGLKPFVDFQAGQPYGPEGPEAEGTFIKTGFENGFQYQFHSSLDHIILHCQDACLWLPSFFGILMVCTISAWYLFFFKSFGYSLFCMGITTPMT